MRETLSHCIRIQAHAKKPNAFTKNKIIIRCSLLRYHTHNKHTHNHIHIHHTHCLPSGIRRAKPHRSGRSWSLSPFLSCGNSWSSHRAMISACKTLSHSIRPIGTCMCASVCVCVRVRVRMLQHWQQLKFTSSYDQRVQDIVAFNQANRYARMCAWMCALLCASVCKCTCIDNSWSPYRAMISACKTLSYSIRPIGMCLHECAWRWVTCVCMCVCACVRGCAWLCVSTRDVFIFLRFLCASLSLLY